MKQESFTPTSDWLMEEIKKIEDREMRSKSEVINMLLHAAIKERNRKKIKKQD